MPSLTNDPGGAASPATMIGPLPSGQRDRRSSEIKAFCPPDRPLQGPGKNPCAECAPGRLMCQIAAPYAAANTPDKITTIPSTTDRASDNISNPRDEHTMIRSPLFPSRSDAGRRESASIGSGPIPCSELRRGQSTILDGLSDIFPKKPLCPTLYSDARKCNGAMPSQPIGGPSDSLCAPLGFSL